MSLPAWEHGLRVLRADIVIEQAQMEAPSVSLWIKYCLRRWSKNCGHLGVVNLTTIKSVLQEIHRQDVIDEIDQMREYLYEHDYF
jgi:hypothetical protein